MSLIYKGNNSVKNVYFSLKIKTLIEKSVFTNFCSSVGIELCAHHNIFEKQNPRYLKFSPCFFKGYNSANNCSFNLKYGTCYVSRLLIAFVLNLSARKILIVCFCFQSEFYKNVLVNTFLYILIFLALRIGS